ncbi:hypothetical protein XM38_011640 [Halomicronema hongdechloris C2206]|uniref:Uncharacterized protein n=1 Tax=Halomicronema hongdechloris C2206 TaxID=1641165 RepID=A0A1Z3HIT2_9CYAN|nr:hypothetical protein XM38_011640 [Halomicronema hongdechloris C2206]
MPTHADSLTTRHWLFGMADGSRDRRFTVIALDGVVACQIVPSARDWRNLDDPMLSGPRDIIAGH